MPSGLTPLLLSMAPMALFVVLRLLARRNHGEVAGEPDGLRVFRGERDECQQALELLSAAGIACWIEDEPAGPAVHVERDQATMVPHLLGAQRAGRAPPADARPAAPQ